jgi:predicted dehydrogenase
MSQKINVAVIGVGHLGKWHADKYAASEDCNLVAVVDTDLDAARAVADKHGAEAVTDYQAILPRIDAISLVVPTSVHYPIAKDCLEAGIHCLIEKPITETVEQAQTLIDLAKAKNLTLQVGHIERFNSVMMDIDDILDKPQFMESTRLAPFTPRATDVSVILDLMIHDIDIILDLIDSPIKHISASGISVLSDEIDIANARLEFESGCVANVTASRVTMKPQRKMRIFQPDAYISIDFQDKVLSVHRKGKKEMFPGIPEITSEESIFDNSDAILAEASAFIDAINNKTAPPVTGEDGRRALDTAIRISELLG